MARNGSGTYSLPSGNPVTTGTTISSTTHNTTMSDVASALTQSVSKDGQTTMTGNLPMGGFRLTGVGAATAGNEYVTATQQQGDYGVYVGTVGGTADVITLTPSPAITAYAAGQRFKFIASGTNTTAVTVNISALGAKNITKAGTNLLVAGDIPSGAMVTIDYDGTQFQLKGIIKSFLYKGCHGCLISNDGSDANNDIDIATGYCIDTTGAYIISLSSAFVKQLDGNWAVGTNAGALDTGAEATSTWYYVYLILKDSDNSVDVLFSTSASSPTMPSGYTYKALIGSFWNNASGNIEPFSSRELSGGAIEYLWSSSTKLDFNSNATTTETNATLTVPTSIVTTAIVQAATTSTTSTDYARVYCTDNPEETPGANNSCVSGTATGSRTPQFHVRTNSSGQVTHDASATMNLTIRTYGYIQERGV